MSRRRNNFEALLDHIELLGLPRPKTLGELNACARRAKELELDAELVERALREMDANPPRVGGPWRQRPTRR